tara:strand:- start:729 stop:935 length:207 start_codon:yes stop_codon:yes gene_type:complete
MINYFDFNSSFDLLNLAFDKVRDDAFFNQGLFNTIAGVASTTFTSVGTPVSTTYSSVSSPISTTWSDA